MNARSPLTNLTNSGRKGTPRKSKRWADVASILRVGDSPANHDSSYNETKDLKVGRWSKSERLIFLRGLRKYGRGKWKKISKMIRTRNTIQVKTHAQVMLKKYDEGRNIFAELDGDEEKERRHQLVQCHAYPRWLPQEAKCVHYVQQLPSNDVVDAARALLLLSQTSGK